MNHLFQLPNELISLVVNKFVDQEYKSLILSLASKELKSFQTWKQDKDASTPNQIAFRRLHSSVEMDFNL